MLRFISLFFFIFIFSTHSSYAQFARDDWTGKDKTRHLYVGTGLSAGVYATCRSIDYSYNKSLILAISAGTATGLFKELLDISIIKNGSGFSGKDLLYTFGGSISGGLISYVIDKKIINRKRRKNKPFNQ